MVSKRIVALAAFACAPAATAQGLDTPVEEAPFDVHALQPVNMPLVALPLDTAQKSAPVWIKGEKPKDDVLARLTLRPAESVAVETDVGQGAGKTLILSRTLTGLPVLYRTAGDLGAVGKRLYCGAGAGVKYAGKILCLEDSDGDGRFESRRTGVGEDGNRPEQVSIVGKAEPLDTPAGYRAARADEIPDIAATYTSCGKDHDRPRYAFGTVEYNATGALTELLQMGDLSTGKIDPQRLAEIGARLQMLSGGRTECVAGDGITADHPLYPSGMARGSIAALLGELVIEVGSKDAGAPVRLVALRTPDRLYRLVGRGVKPLFETVTSRQNQLAVSQKFDKPVVMTSGPAKIFEGVKGPGDVILTAGFGHGYMGVLTQDTTIRTLLSSRSVPKGATVYGVPMSTRRVMTINGIPQGPYGPVGTPGPNEVRLVWCLPVEDEGKWSATCLPDQGGRYTLLKGQKPAFEVTGFSYDAGTSSNDGAVPVAAQSGSFAQPLSYRFTLTTVTDASLTVTQDTLVGDVVTNSRLHQIGRVKGMRSGLTFGGGTIALGEADGGKILVKTVRPVVSGVDTQVRSGLLRAEEAAPPPRTT